mgnify:CR=1 FL=1
MSKAPSMPMYWDAYIADTTHLSTEEHGAYLLLLAAMWRRDGSVPDDDKDNARILGLTPGKWRRVKARLSEFLIFENDHISQKNLREIWKKTQEKIAINSQNGAKGGRPKSNKNKDMAKANGSISDNPNETIPEPEPYRDTNVSLSKRAKPKPERFQEFWDQYPHRNGRKEKRADAEKKYANAVAAGFSEELIISKAISYAQTDDVRRGYGRAVLTWLNQKGWEDESDPNHRAPTTRNGGRSNPHDSLVAGFAAFANSDDSRGEPDFGGGEAFDGPGNDTVDFGPGGNTSQPIFRVIGSN